MRARFPKVRRRIHRAFINWYEQNQARFPVALQFAGRKDNCLAIRFSGLHASIQLTLTWELLVAVEWQGDCWDTLGCFEAVPIKTPGGYCCALCPAEKQVSFSSREALWQDHLFEPLLIWLTTTLLPAKWLGLYGGIGEGATWVKLLTEPDPDARQILCLWQ